MILSVYVFYEANVQQFRSRFRLKMIEFAVLLLSIFVTVKTSFSYPEEMMAKANNPTAEYIFSLIDMENARDSTRNHDLAIIRLEEKLKRGKFDEIVEKLLIKNTKNNAVLVHSSFDDLPPYRVHEFSFYVIFSDIQDYVRIFQYVQNFKTMLFNFFLTGQTAISHKVCSSRQSLVKFCTIYSHFTSKHSNYKREHFLVL